MEKCRICLGNKQTLMSIFDDSKCTTYAFMMLSIANVKIQKDDGITNKICRGCRKSLTDAYDLKLKIERSDAALNDNVHKRKINFNNLNDIKIEIGIEPDQTDDKYAITKCKDFTELFKPKASEICYNDTVIKKIKSDKKCKQPIPMLDFLKSIKSSDNSSDDDNVEMDTYDAYYTDGDDEYVPPKELLGTEKTRRKYTKRKKMIKEKPNVKSKSNNEKKNKMCIKPMYLYDLKLIYDQKTKYKIDPKVKKKYAKTPHICPHCGIMTKNLESHMLIHTGERKYKCDACDKAYVTLSALTSHKYSHSTKVFKCEICVEEFRTKMSLESHKLSHSSEKKHVCNICSKAFKRTSALRRHWLMHNSANKTVKCELCNMSFFNRPGLRHHMRIHTGERPYNCEICSQPYSYKHDFNRHCFNKHEVFLKRRSIYVMNEEVLKQERKLMKELILRVNSIIKGDKPLNPFEGPQAARAFEQGLKALKLRQIPVNLQL